MLRPVAICLQLIALRAAFADPAWQAPKGCPSADDVRARIERRLDHSLDETTAGVEVRVTRAHGRYQARVDLAAITVANDVRTLSSPRCTELADAVAVIVARVASEATARNAERDDGTHEAAAPPVAVAVVDDEPPSGLRLEDAPEASGAPAQPRPWTLGARLSGVNGIGILPEIGLGTELALTVRKGRHLAELGGAAWFASAAQFHNGSNRKVDVELQTAVARYGWRPYEMPLRGWAAVEVGNMRGTDVRSSAPGLDGGRWIAAGAGFGIAWQMKPWARLVGTTEVMLAVERVKFTTSDGVVAYAPSPMSVRTTCGLELGWQ